MPDRPDIAAQLLRGQRRQLRAMLVCFLGLAALTLYVLVQQSRTHDALCSLQADLVHRVQAETDFLAKNPNGIPGVSPASLRATISGQERTIKALEPLQCSTKG